MINRNFWEAFEVKQEILKKIHRKNSKKDSIPFKDILKHNITDQLDERFFLLT